MFPLSAQRNPIAALGHYSILFCLSDDAKSGSRPSQKRRLTGLRIFRSGAESSYTSGKNKLRGKMRSRLKYLGSAAALVLATVSYPAHSDSRYPFGDAGGTHTSPLTQINKKNVGKLKEIWRYDLKLDGELENTPIVVDGVLYGVAAGRVIALDAATGAEK